jgi:hypothetical protein
MATAVVLFLLMIVGGATYFVTYKPKFRPASTEQVESTPARLERGRYLAEAVFGCFDCHADHDVKKYGLPVVGPLGAGGVCMGQPGAFPGVICMPNITPDRETGLGNWSDGEIIRAVREGVDRDGRWLFPAMPFREYQAISDEDARALVVYLRSLPPVKRTVPERQTTFMANMMKFAVSPLEGPVAEPNRQDKVAYGKYLAKVSGCQFCHSPVDKMHQGIGEMAFAGGQEFPGPWGSLRSSNLTPHATGLGDRTEAQFVGMFKAFDLPLAALPEVAMKDNTMMPWLTRAKLTEADLGAIYAYLRTVRPINRTVQKRPQPTLKPAGDASPPAR